jgi:predicted Zn finger-like uncharacterized protein
MVLHPRAARHVGLFTQCSNCNTVFELSAEVLRAAGGQVRCGRCGQIFNALARLAEDAGSFDVGESSFDMEERADSILESVPAEGEAPPAPAADDEEEYGSIEIAQLQVLDFSEENLIDESVEDAIPEAAAEVYPDAALEFTLPPGELDRIFIESSVGIMPPLPPLERSSEERAHLEASFEQAEFEQAELEQAAREQHVLPEPEPSEAESIEIESIEIASMQTAPDDDGGPLPDIEVISNDTFDLHDAPKSLGKSFGLWLGAAFTAALLLVGQLVHHNRETLTAHGPLAPLLRTLYAGIGAPLGGSPNLAAFQLRQWGVTGEASGDPTLRVRASILNTTAQLQPFPLLRVTLANRFGTRIGTRDFQPGEYVGQPIARLLSPGEKVDAVLNILDPGKDAEGFEIDVCLPGGDKKIVCANDTAPSQARQ